MYWYKTNKFRYALAGALFGCCFPIIAVGIDIWRLGLTWSDVGYVQTEFPIHLIIDTAPFFLGMFALFGGVRQDKIEEINRQLQRDSDDKDKVLEENKEEQKRVTQELSIAKEIQLSMLPLDFPAFPNRKEIDIHAKVIPAWAVGGDFYDFYFLDAQHLYFVVGDVSGKGVSAALMMAVCKTLLKSTAKGTISTAAVLERVNEEMAKDNKNCMFVTAFMGVLNVQTGELRYSNAGHCPMYIKRVNGNVLKIKEVHGIVLGAVEQAKYKEDSLVLECGDKILLYTDGVTDAHNPAGAFFGDERLRTWLDNQPRNTSAQAMTTALIQQVQTFEAGKESFDDLTVLVVGWNA